MTRPLQYSYCFSSRTIARTTLTPDGVAYFENAERFARGQWSEAIQGYWSPGYSLLLVPVVWLASEDRALFLSLAHLLQALLAIAALWLSVLSVRARVPALAQRAVFWGCAWIELRWLTQEVLTPDLLLCVLLLLFIVRLPTHNKRVQLDFTRPGKPTDNSHHIESFNGRLRDECLNVHQFLSIDHAKQLIEAWRIDYNQHRPYSSLGHLTPNDFAIHGQVHGPETVGSL